MISFQFQLINLTSVYLDIPIHLDNSDLDISIQTIRYT